MTTDHTKTDQAAAEAAATITDGTGRKWRMMITGNVYKALKEDHGIDLLNEKTLGEVMTDVVKRSEVMISILSRQAAKLDLDRDDVDLILFERSTTPRPSIAMEAALAEFYASQNLGFMVGVMKKVRAAAEKVQAKAMARINSPETQRIIDREIAKAERKMDAAMAKMDAQQNADEKAYADSLVESPS